MNTDIDFVQKAKAWLTSMGFDPDDERNVAELAAVFRSLAARADRAPITPTSSEES